MTQENRVQAIHRINPISWLSLWLFTIGMTHANAGTAALGILLWPYHLGQAIARLAGS